MRTTKLYWQILQTRQSFTGFTLIELLVAIVISGIVLILAGSGLSIMTAKNQAAEVETQRRVQLNRALEYMSEDIRTARSINPASGYTIASITPSCATATPILTLNELNGTTPKTIVYYLSDLSSCSDIQTVWLKPGVIKRVDLGTSTSTTIDDSNGQELVDAISNTAAPACSSGSIVPTSNAKGFYACLDSASNARVVELHLRARLTQDSTKIYQVTSKAFTRSSL